MNTNKNAKKNILCVDDEPLILSTIIRIFHKYPYRIIKASNGKEALKLIESENIDLLIIDVYMPEMDGYELLNSIKAKGYENIPAVMLTAAISDQQTMKAYGMGCDYYISKPFHPERIINIVQYFIGDISDKEKKEIEERL